MQISRHLKLTIVSAHFTYEDLVGASVRAAARAEEPALFDPRVFVLVAEVLDLGREAEQQELGVAR